MTECIQNIIASTNRYGTSSYYLLMTRTCDHKQHEDDAQFGKNGEDDNNSYSLWEDLQKNSGKILSIFSLLWSKIAKEAKLRIGSFDSMQERNDGQLMMWNCKGIYKNWYSEMMCILWRNVAYTWRRALECLTCGKNCYCIVLNANKNFGHSKGIVQSMIARKHHFLLSLKFQVHTIKKIPQKCRLFCILKLFTEFILLIIGNSL